MTKMRIQSPRSRVGPVFMMSWTVLILLHMAEAFTPMRPFIRTTLPLIRPTSLRTSMLDPCVVATVLSDSVTASASSYSLMDLVASQSSSWLAFADQGQNLAGIFFQASLLPYLFFLYFLAFRANRLADLANFGFQYVLLFVMSTIPSGILAKSVYGTSLANVDWLHGGAETLLTMANILIVLGLAQTMTQTDPPSYMNRGRTAGIVLALVFALSCAAGPALGFQDHSAFLLGLGNLPTDWVQALPWVTHNEPINALSIPTWAIHFSSVFEYLFAMNLVWKYAETTQTPAWKGLTWGMLPLHASGICACTYHFFYNAAMLQFLVTMQAGLTLLGNLTCAYAAYRIARRNGWTVDELIPMPRSSTNPTGLIADGMATLPLRVNPLAADSTPILAGKLVALTVVSSYLVKYGELGLDVPFVPNAPLALLMVLGIPALTAFQYYQLSQQIPPPSGETWTLNEPSGKSVVPFSSSSSSRAAMVTTTSAVAAPTVLPSDTTNESINSSTNESSNKPLLSMADIKKYGVAGTVAYILTELAFWALAFPVAATALYQTTGHWPDVWQSNTDRAAVLAFILAGANIARVMVPLRLGAALALAPWVDENLLQGQLSLPNLFQGPASSSSSTTPSSSSLSAAESNVQQETLTTEGEITTPAASRVSSTMTERSR